MFLGVLSPRNQMEMLFCNFTFLIAFVRKHYIPEGLKYSIQRSKNKKNENHEVGSFSEVKMSKITVPGMVPGMVPKVRCQLSA